MEVEARLKQDLEEQQMTISALYVQKSELQLRFQNFENKIAKTLITSQEVDGALMRKVSFTTREASPLNSYCQQCGAKDTPQK